MDRCSVPAHARPPGQLYDEHMTASPRFGASRIDGLDVARALAVLGMVAAHIGNSGRRGPAHGWGWLWIADGRPSALFAVLAGVSMSLMAVRAVHRVGAAHRVEALRHTRIRIIARGLILIVVGYLLTALDTPVLIILANLGVMFVLGSTVLGWRARSLALAAVVPLTAGWFVMETTGAQTWPHVPVVGVLWSEGYPVTSWMSYVLAGMAMGRLALTSRRIQALVATAGLSLAAVAYSLGPMLDGTGLDPANMPGMVEWASVEAHSYTPFEMFGNLGVAMAVIAMCVAVTPYLRPSLWPLLATGSMAFTVYVIQILVIAAAGYEVVYIPSNITMVVLCAALVGFASLWRWHAGQGPLERAMTRASSAAADAVTSPAVRGD
ncbi:MAG: hypothetical protein CVT64_04170 [Actinobacteria bacterium HGW-Actinobacteria-4]|nr:MAG: hypothetical protein CVT64_04170 [Actinobacteria bacterium HGW-Actinobacteria-4]